MIVPRRSDDFRFLGPVFDVGMTLYVNGWLAESPQKERFLTLVSPEARLPLPFFVAELEVRPPGKLHGSGVMQTFASPLASRSVFCFSSRSHDMSSDETIELRLVGFSPGMLESYRARRAPTAELSTRICRATATVETALRRR